MTEPQDEASEKVSAGMRTAMAAAAQAAQRVMRALEQRRRETQAASEQRAAELRARFDAECAAARAVLTPVGRDDWWATARPAQITAAYETAHAWESLDPEARIAADRIRSEVDPRYGVDSSSADHAEQLNRDAVEERVEARLDEAAAVAAGVGVAVDISERGEADTEYQTATRLREGDLWDSAERRNDTARSLEGKASAEAVNVRMCVDKGQGKPARVAVIQATTKTTAKNNTTAAGKGITRQSAHRPHV